MPSSSATTPHHNAYLNLFFFNVFFACVSFSIIMPSLSPYLERCGSTSPQYLAQVVAIYSIGEMVGSLLFGYIYNVCTRRSRTFGPKFVMLLSVGTGVFGSFLYIAADIFTNPALALYGRFLQGLWTGGQQSVEQAYLAYAALPGERTELTSRLGTFAVLGFILGPAFGAVFTSLDVHILGFHLDAYTAPGVFIIFASSSMWCMTAKNFNPTSMSGRELAKSQSGSALSALAVDGSEKEKGANGNDADDDANLPAPSTGAIFTLLVMFFVHFYSFAVQETITTPLVLNLYGFEQYEVNLLFVAVGILSLLTSYIVGIMSRFFSDRTILISSILLGLLGSVVLIDSSERFLELDRFFIGFAIITVAFPMGRNVTISIYSAVLGNVEQGFYMGLMLAVGAIPRALGPFWAIKSLQIAEDERGHYHTWLEFETASAMFLVGLAFVICTYKSLVPFEDYHGLTGGDTDGVDIENDKGAGGKGAGPTEASPLLATNKSPGDRPGRSNSSEVTPGKRLVERRSSFRPALVAQIQGEFPSSTDLQGLSKKSESSGKK
jgi:ceroid-lipofuscinosis MFS transporter 7